MNASAAAWRAEIVAYQGAPAPRMFHLGEAFSLDADALRGAVRARVMEIADCLAAGDEDERRAAAEFRSWADTLASAEPRHRLERGELLIHSFAAAGCVWEMSLRPVAGCCEGVR
ncbi:MULTISPECIES: hypothetical protein [unclassified Streptomyces]|uniref:hypothetical protein n=1 Tax=unclassified Streptomyces TaxID=2593676 RepID=UPI000CD551B4|nr:MULTISPECIES: hypothetical protein [unclassified Streptomyces]